MSNESSMLKIERDITRIEKELAEAKAKLASMTAEEKFKLAKYEQQVDFLVNLLVKTMGRDIETEVGLQGYYKGKEMIPMVCIGDQRHGNPLRFCLSDDWIIDFTEIGIIDDEWLAERKRVKYDFFENSKEYSSFAIHLSDQDFKKKLRQHMFKHCA